MDLCTGKCCEPKKGNRHLNLFVRAWLLPVAGMRPFMWEGLFRRQFWLIGIKGLGVGSQGQWVSRRAPAALPMYKPHIGCCSFESTLVDAVVEKKCSPYCEAVKLLSKSDVNEPTCLRVTKTA